MAEYSSPFEAMLVSGGTQFILAFYDRIPMNDIYRIGRTCFTIQQTVILYRDIRFNIEFFLQRWVDVASEFQRRMWQADAVIAGPAALLFLQRTSRKRADLDILVPMAGALSLGSYFMDMGYDFQGKSTDPPDFRETLAIMNTRTRLDRIGRPGRDTTALVIREFRFFMSEPDGDGYYTPRSIKMNVLRTHPIRYLIQSHNTAWMTFITASFSACLFPRATIVEEKTYSSRRALRTNDLSRIWEKEYKAKYKRLQDTGVSHPVTRETATALRAVGDCKSWLIPYDQDELNIPKHEITAYDHCLRGITFDVVDFRSRIPTPGAFMRVSEPFTLTYVLYCVKLGRD